MTAPSPVRIRPAVAADAAAIARHRVRLFQELGRPEQAVALESFFGASRAALLEGLGAGTTLAWVTDEPEPAGSVVMHLVRRLPSPTSPTGREGYIIHVYVDPARRNGGAGAELLRQAVAAARALGLSRVRLHSADRALPFYLREGFLPRRNDMEMLLG